MDREIYQETIEKILSNINKLEINKKNVECECNKTCSFESQRYTFEMSKKMKNLMCVDLFKHISQFYKTTK